VYGTHFVDYLTGPKYGRFQLACNEPTAETISQFENVVGAAKFNSSGGAIILTPGNNSIWTDNVFRKCHTGFLKMEPIMTVGTLSNYIISYQIDLGSGFSDWKNLYSPRGGASGSSGAFTFTVTNATDVAVGDYCFGTGLSTIGVGMENAVVPRVTQVVGNTITVDVANTGTVSGTVRFNHLPNEIVDPAIGFKMKTEVVLFYSFNCFLISALSLSFTSPINIKHFIHLFSNFSFKIFAWSIYSENKIHLLFQIVSITVLTIKLFLLSSQ
jgi:hypothetical protein